MICVSSLKSIGSEKLSKIWLTKKPTAKILRNISLGMFFQSLYFINSNC